MHHQHINMGYGLKHMFRMAYCFAVHRKSTIHLRAEIVMVFLAFILMEFLAFIFFEYFHVSAIICSLSAVYLCQMEIIYECFHVTHFACI